MSPCFRYHGISKWSAQADPGWLSGRPTSGGPFSAGSLISTRQITALLGILCSQFAVLIVWNSSCRGISKLHRSAACEGFLTLVGFLSQNQSIQGIITWDYFSCRNQNLDLNASEVRERICSEGQRPDALGGFCLLCTVLLARQSDQRGITTLCTCPAPIRFPL